MRIIARLDIKNEFVIKSIHLEGLRKVGDPIELANKYYQGGVDELIFMDAVASLYDRNNLFDVISKACESVFVPITIGGGLRTIDDIHKALDSGADKVALNTAAIKNPEFVYQAARKFGSQAIVLSIESKKKDNSWFCYYNNGRENSNIAVLKWVDQVQKLGAGEILLTSVDREGTNKGMDLDLYQAVKAQTTLPIILSGGFDPGNEDRLSVDFPAAIAVAGAIHYDRTSISQVKSKIQQLGGQVR